MCRYGFHSYKGKYACFKCRKTFRYSGANTCPQCSGELFGMGLDFKSPRKNDIKQWKKVEKLYMNDVKFGSCGCGGPGYRPARLNQVDEFLDSQRCNKLLQDKRRRFLLNHE